MSRLVFINLPVADLDRSKEFFGALGFEFDPKFTDDSCVCMVINEGASYAMLLDRERFADFTTTPVADGHSTTEAIVCLSADSRDDVDEFADTALSAGGSVARDAMDMGFMYGRSFLDPDGHLWEVMWMSQEAIEAEPQDMVEQPA